MIHKRQGNKLLMPIGWQENLDNKHRDQKYSEYKK